MIKMKKNKTVIICPYFGKLPKNIYYTMKSMGNNYNFDWFIITDDNIENYNFKNIKIIKQSFEDIKKLIKDKIDCNINNVYKLCDYKPVYGKIFEDYIIEYSHWGYCDLDMVFGNIDKFITDTMLDKYDKIFDLGHFSIIKNNKAVNEIYTKIEHYKEILNSEYIYVLDESYNNHISINEILENNGFKVYRNRNIISDIIIKFNNFFIVGKKKKKYTYFYYKNRSLYVSYMSNVSTEETIYVHFQKRKFKTYNNCNKDEFCITPIGFFNTNNVSSKMFYKIHKYRLITYIKIRAKRFFDNKKRRII